MSSECRKPERRGRAINTREPIWSAAARADLFEDHSYIARENPEAADRFFIDVYRRVEAFARNGLGGVARDEFGNNIRSFAYRERTIFFQLSETELTVLRVVHGRQDISPAFFKKQKD